MLSIGAENGTMKKKKNEQAVLPGEVLSRRAARARQFNYETTEGSFQKAREHKNSPQSVHFAKMALRAGLSSARALGVSPALLATMDSEGCCESSVSIQRSKFLSTATCRAVLPFWRGLRVGRREERRKIFKKRNRKESQPSQTPKEPCRPRWQ
jgi:hypothetical protein